MGIENFMTFAVTALFFIMTPGIDSVFVLNKSMGQGKISGTYASFGVNAGTLVHTLLGALGLSVIVANSPIAFTVIKYVGATYLIYLGVMKIRNNNNNILAGNDSEKQKVNPKNNFISGFVTNVLNPKVALFFLAFFPQFITHDQVENPMPFLILGLTYALIAMVWFFLLIFFAGVFSKKIKENDKIGQRINILTSVVFILMGLQIAFT